jgi:phage-related protein
MPKGGESLLHQWQKTVFIYATPGGKTPVKDFLDKLSHSGRSRALYGLTQLQNAGFRLGPPWLKKINDDLWELRLEAERTQIRILFSHESQGFLLLHAIRKKSQKLPKDAIELAHQRLREYRSRR